MLLRHGDYLIIIVDDFDNLQELLGVLALDLLCFLGHLLPGVFEAVLDLAKDIT